jgi:hypothetical protein
MHLSGQTGFLPRTLTMLTESERKVDDDTGVVAIVYVLQW